MCKSHTLQVENSDLMLFSVVGLSDVEVICLCVMEHRVNYCLLLS